jgi:hypothetical protein
MRRKSRREKHRRKTPSREWRSTRRKKIETESHSRTIRGAILEGGARFSFLSQCGRETGKNSATWVIEHMVQTEFPCIYLFSILVLEDPTKKIKP